MLLVKVWVLRSEQVRLQQVLAVVSVLRQVPLSSAVLQSACRLVLQSVRLRVVAPPVCTTRQRRATNFLSNFQTIWNLQNNFSRLAQIGRVFFSYFQQNFCIEVPAKYVRQRCFQPPQGLQLFGQVLKVCRILDQIC